MIERPHVTLDAQSTEWDEPPWPSAFELAFLLPERSWTLVGGLMVKLHAELASLPAPRSTLDVDTTLHLETKSITFGQAAETLKNAGYRLNEDTQYAYRFDRGAERIDVMCSDRHAISKHPRYRGRPLFGVPGGTRALMRTINVDADTPRGTAQLIVPDVRGALVLKGAAYLEDSRDRARHAEDAVLLLACLTDPHGAIADLSNRSRKRIRTLVEVLTEHSAPWTNHDGIVQSLAKETLEELNGIMHIESKRDS
ncbi:hypothetical protein [Paramicrobacterium fandaimingii]|uniref:hypothetical protein n=1 Tax=Paramicrobacterium fandaimingii TaxID=2708079 RepID=UPI00141F02E2|nr:hypothetical protein [Microbacterium fandaimingii]